MRVLIAEDEPISRRMLESSLTRWGYQVTAARNGIEAWQAFQKGNPPPLVILDWIMPGMDGPEVCQKIRGRPDHPSIYILLLAPEGLRGNIKEGLRTGANDYLIKPFDEKELYARLQAGAVFVNRQKVSAVGAEVKGNFPAPGALLQGFPTVCPNHETGQSGGQNGPRFAEGRPPPSRCLHCAHEIVKSD